MSIRKFIQACSLSLATILLSVVETPHKSVDAGEIPLTNKLVVLPSHHDFATTSERIESSVSSNGMFVLAKASASAGAAKRGVRIPGDAVFLVFRNDFAVRMLGVSVAAGIEAPIPIHVYEVPGGAASIAYRRPSSVFQPYGDKALNEMAEELDEIFDRIVTHAARE